MCGIVGVVSQNPVNQLLYDALLLLQHRGQDAAGIATNHGNMFSMHKANGLVRDVFRTRNMRSLQGNIGHRPLPLSDRRLVQRRGSAAVLCQCAVRHHAGAQRQPDQPGAAEDRDVPQRPPPHQHRFRFRSAAQRAGARNPGGHHRLSRSTRTPCSRRWPSLHRRVRGAYAVVAQIAGYGLLAFRDPFGIRPLCIGVNETDAGHRIPGGQRIGGAGRPGLPLRARHRAGRSDLHRRRRQAARAASAPTTRRSTRARSNSSTWPVRTRSSTAPRSTPRA